MKWIPAMAVIVLGMFGLYMHIEYSGWVLFFGLLGLRGT